MIASILSIIGAILAIVIGLWKRGSRIATEKRKQAEQAQKDLQHANETDNPSDFLDAFGRLRK